MYCKKVAKQRYDFTMYYQLTSFLLVELLNDTTIFLVLNLFPMHFNSIYEFCLSENCPCVLAVLLISQLT